MGSSLLPRPVQADDSKAPRRNSHASKSVGLDGPGRIGWVTLSRSMRSFYYQDKRFEKTKSGYNYNGFDAETGAEYWISGPRKNGRDKLYGGVVEIDEDARVAYWTEIRNKPGFALLGMYRA